MAIHKATRLQVKLKLGVSGVSGSGKTYSALMLASGMTSWDKICIIDTENKSAELYAHLGDYSAITLEAPFTPEKYIEAIHEAENAGMEVIVIDSMTHEWDGKGGILEMHDSMPGNSYTNWAKFTPRHNAFIEAILQSKCHVICTLRSKQDYVLVEKNGKQVPEKVGLRAITREGIEYELTLVFDINIKHQAVTSKDRTGLFVDRPEFVISAETGKTILSWTKTGAKRYIAPGDSITKETLSAINDLQAKTGQDLKGALEFLKADALEELAESEGVKILAKLKKIQAEQELIANPKESVDVDAIDKAIEGDKEEPPKGGKILLTPPGTPVVESGNEAGVAVPKASKGTQMMLASILKKKAQDFETPLPQMIEVVLAEYGVAKIDDLSANQTLAAINYLTSLHPAAKEPVENPTSAGIEPADSETNGDTKAPAEIDKDFEALGIDTK